MANRLLGWVKIGIRTKQRGLQEADDQIGVADPDAINADERHLPAWCIVQVRFKDGFVVDAKEAQISFKLCRKWRKTWYKPQQFRIRNSEVMEFNDRQSIDCTLVIRIDIDLESFHPFASTTISYTSHL